MAYQEKQPQPVVAMTVAPGGNRNAKNLPYSPQGTRQWSHGLCGCCSDCGTCCLATVCPCMVYAQVKHRIEHLNQYGRPDPQRGGSGCDGDCMTWFCLQNILGAGWVLQIPNRALIRGRYNIAGSGTGDCCAALCCGPCELTQESRELALEENSLAA